MSEAPSELSDTERIQAQIERIDALLAEGSAAMAKLDQFYQEHGFVPGIGEKVLLSDQVPERHRIIFAKIIAELRVIDQRIDEFDPAKARPATIPAGTRAIGNRYRI